MGELGPELAEWQFERAEYAGETVLDKPLNWKIANDTFGEVYHFKSLHRNTLANLFHGDVTCYQEYGRNHRLVVANKFLDTMRHQPESNWSLSDGAIVVYYLFPNIQLAIFNRMVALVKIYPNRRHVGQSLSRVSHYAAHHVAEHMVDLKAPNQLTGENLYKADTSARVEFNLATQVELFMSTVEHEDYYMGEKSQRAAESGAVPLFIFGRNEPALHHFHNNYRSALGMPALQEYQAQ